MLSRGLESKCRSNIKYFYYYSSSINNINYNQYRYFCVQEKLHKDIKNEEDINNHNNDYDNIEYEDNIIQLTPQQKIREWTRIYHKIQSSKWIKNNLGK